MPGAEGEARGASNGASDGYSNGASDGYSNGASDGFDTDTSEAGASSDGRDYGQGRGDNRGGREDNRGGRGDNRGGRGDNRVGRWDNRGGRGGNRGRRGDNGGGRGDNRGGRGDNRGGIGDNRGGRGGNRGGRWGMSREERDNGNWIIGTIVGLTEGITNSVVFYFVRANQNHVGRDIRMHIFKLPVVDRFFRLENGTELEYTIHLRNDKPEVGRMNIFRRNYRKNTLLQVMENTIERCEREVELTPMLRSLHAWAFLGNSR